MLKVSKDKALNETTKQHGLIIIFWVIKKTRPKQAFWFSVPMKKTAGKLDVRFALKSSIKAML